VHDESWIHSDDELQFGGHDELQFGGHDELEFGGRDEPVMPRYLHFARAEAPSDGCPTR
jgi:hypothetical protein